MSSVSDSPSHPLRVRELKLTARIYPIADTMSHPLRVRELKRCMSWSRSPIPLSHPLRVRELKLIKIAAFGIVHVAPFTGA